jgi:hypothetical protein
VRIVDEEAGVVRCGERPVQGRRGQDANTDVRRAESLPCLLRWSPPPCGPGRRTPDPGPDDQSSRSHRVQHAVGATLSISRNLDFLGQGPPHLSSDPAPSRRSPCAYQPVRHRDRYKRWGYAARQAPGPDLLGEVEKPGILISACPLGRPGRRSGPRGRGTTRPVGEMSRPLGEEQPPRKSRRAARGGSPSRRSRARSSAGPRVTKTMLGSPAPRALRGRRRRVLASRTESGPGPDRSSGPDPEPVGVRTGIHRPTLGGSAC